MYDFVWQKLGFDINLILFKQYKEFYTGGSHLSSTAIKLDSHFAWIFLSIFLV